MADVLEFRRSVGRPQNPENRLRDDEGYAREQMAKSTGRRADMWRTLAAHIAACREELEKKA